MRKGTTASRYSRTMTSFGGFVNRQASERWSGGRRSQILQLWSTYFGIAIIAKLDKVGS